MNDARWFELDEDVAAAKRHFARSVELFEANGFDDESLEGYKAQMALMHAMQSGHTSLESALVRILHLIGEDVPVGPDWHSDLIRRASRSIGKRPAILSGEVAAAANETRRFRHVAMRSYDGFDPARARPAISAAALLARDLLAAIAAFKQQIDPPG